MNRAAEPSALSPHPGEVPTDASVLEAVHLIGSIRDAPDSATAVQLLRSITRLLGADAAVFTSYVQDDGSRASYRSLLACDPVWASQYAEHGWCLDDPWLRHALGSAAPICAQDLQPVSAAERWVLDGARHFGFQSAWVVPAPTPAAQSRTGVLCVGSGQNGFFDSAAAAPLKVLARSLAMELGDWLQQQVRAGLMARAHITADDLQLLRHQQLGHNSKHIAALLQTEAKTIDCRFQRLNLRLGAANRRSAVRLAELYGLI